MTLLFRLIRVFFGARLRPKLAFTDLSILPMRVWPNDLDMYLHVNNGRYLTMMDLGRVDLLTRSGMGDLARKRGWNPLVGSVRINFRRSLRVFEKFTIRTRLIWWDDKWVFLEQNFERNGQVVAEAVVKGLFRGREGSIPTGVLFSTLGINPPCPPMPDAVKAFLE